MITPPLLSHRTEKQAITTERTNNFHKNQNRFCKYKTRNRNVQQHHWEEEEEEEEDDDDDDDDDASVMMHDDKE